MRFTFSGKDLTAPCQRVIANVLRLGVKMRLGIKALIFRGQMHAGMVDKPKPPPFAVAFHRKDLGDGLLCKGVTRIRNDTTILVFHHTPGCYFLLNQHGHALQ